MEIPKMDNPDRMEEKGSAEGSDLKSKHQSGGMNLPIRLVDYNSDSNSSWAAEAHAIPDNTGGNNRAAGSEQPESNKGIDSVKEMDKNQIDQTDTKTDNANKVESNLNGNEIECNRPITPESKDEDTIKEKEVNSVVMQEITTKCDEVTDCTDKCSERQESIEMKDNLADKGMIHEDEKCNEPNGIKTEDICIKTEPLENIEDESELKNSQNESENVMEIKPISSIIDENSKDSASKTGNLSPIPAEIENATSLPVMCLVEVKQEKEVESGEAKQQTGDYNLLVHCPSQGASDSADPLPSRGATDSAKGLLVEVMHYPS